jgi:hypothetical protein
MNNVPGIHAAIVSVMRDVGAIAKECRNDQQGFNFRSIEQVYNRVQPLFAKHGIYSTTRVIKHQREERESHRGAKLTYSILEIEFTYYAQDGSCVSNVTIGEGMDSGDKASNKAMAVADKYSICQLLKIPYQLDDPDRDDPMQAAQGLRARALAEIKKSRTVERLGACQSRADEMLADGAMDEDLHKELGEAIRLREQELMKADA